MKPANYAPVYAGLYPELAEIARKHGYAMAVHGSFARDADLICIPWTDEASEPQAVVDAITSEFVVRSVGEPSTREHGRIVYTLPVAAPGCFIDLSFTPRSASAPVGVVETAWLIELKGSRPAWWTLHPDEEPGWLADANKALRFARQEDAENYIEDHAWTDVFATEHSWPAHSPAVVEGK